MAIHASYDQHIYKRVIGIQHTIIIDKHIMSFHKVERDIKRGGGGSEREKSRERGRGRGGGMEIKGSNGREGLAFSRFYVHVLRAEGGDCWWFGHSFHVTSARQCLLCQ